MKLLTESDIAAARKFGLGLTRRYRMPRDEAVSLAYLGLCIAANRFDDALGVPFLAHAFQTIRWTFADSARGRMTSGRRVHATPSEELGDVPYDARIEQRLDARAALGRISASCERAEAIALQCLALDAAPTAARAKARGCGRTAAWRNIRRVRAIAMTEAEL